MSSKGSTEPTAGSVAILGAGIIGLSTAYYLTTLSPSTQIHIIDTSPTLFSCASGRASGFLGSPSWFSPRLTSLATLSRSLHKSLADELDGAKKWGYVRSVGLSLVEEGQKSRGEDWILSGGSRSSVKNEIESDGSGSGSIVPAWLKDGKGRCKIIDADAAQVYPKRLCEFLLSACQSRGVKLYNPATPTQIHHDGARVTGITISTPNSSNETIQCSHILLSAGPWTPRLFASLFPNSKTSIPITNLPGTSVTLSPKTKKKEENAEEVCHAVFAVSKDGWSPELFSRRDGDIHFAGLNAPHQPLPEVASEESRLDANVMKIINEAKGLIKGVDEGGEEDGYTASVGECCHRPVSETGVPIMCRLDGKVLGEEWVEEGDDSGRVGGVYIASGHSVWGIALSLGTGMVMAEKMLGRRTSADIEGLELS